MTVWPTVTDGGLHVFATLTDGRNRFVELLAALGPSTFGKPPTVQVALAVVLRLLLAQRLVDTDGLPGADRQGVYEPQELTGSKVLAKLAKRVAPPSVRQHLAEQQAERERREQARREEQAAKLAEQRAKLAAGEAVRCACCFEPITSSADAAEKHGSLVHKGDCEQQWGSAYDESDDPDVMDDVGAHDLLELAAAADQDPVEAQLRSVCVRV